MQPGSRGPEFLTSAEARHYRDALMLWPSPHCALEYQRMFVRNRFRTMGRDFRRCSGNHELYRCCPFTAKKINSFHYPRWLRLNAGSMPATRLVSLPGVGHLPHEEDPKVVTSAIIDWLTAP